VVLRDYQLNYQPVLPIQEMQEGWITYEEFDAFENYVLNHTIGDDNYSYDDLFDSFE
jgi:hypothetical protein